jgi:hypothetical protein
VRSSAWIWDFSSTAEHNCLLGWMQLQPDDVTNLGVQVGTSGDLEGLGLPGLDVVLGPDLATVLWQTPSSLASSREDQWVPPAPWAAG